MTNELQDILDFAHRLAWQAGKITLRYFQSDLLVDRKADDSPVTIADRETEAFLRAALSERYPDHAILGEEEGLTGVATSSYRWILDPIDGTKSFIRGVPLYGVMMALLREHEPVVGVVNMPATGEIVYAARGAGCWWNGRPCRVSSVSRLRESLVVATIAHGYEQYGKDAALARIIDASGLFRTWGDCYGHLLVATGRAEVALDPIMNIWDNAALLPILEEAGGTFTDWQGVTTIERGDGISTNGLVLDELMEVIG
ncbi:inositol monophosphatase family protein [Candidatus Chloroploca sp. M-50]|uniref:Inositol monophosphatase family protein n=1 Tax=Candidatus Chloroploca mongolica TaxID=2528176 RepID=A0ABS4DAL3_9CHLR|nr:inositol monophosphatase family protein [Candidatus Chloroploca mongolica]MBP1466349.1 inositol monophosphatase family protein [Candidatus Chloroploca mongolica]